MNKSILMSIQPQWLARILNGEKTLEIRKKFPKDYVGWVYIYCTKNQGRNGEIQLVRNIKTKKYYLWKDLESYNANDIRSGYNGKVVARFWCDKVEEIFPLAMDKQTEYETLTKNWNTLYKLSCLSQKEMFDYLGDRNEGGYAIHISKLEVFDKPMLITMFRKVGFRKFLNDSKPNRLSLLETLQKYSITKAPQSWQFIEGE